MFESRSPLYLILCALALLAWSVALPESTRVAVVSWALAVLMAVYLVSAAAFRGGRSEPSIASTLDDAARLNAARIAAPRPMPPSGATR
jgi:hypothetical protein